MHTHVKANPFLPKEPTFSYKLHRHISLGLETQQLPDGSRQQHRQLGASQTKEGQGEEEVGGGEEEGRGSPERRVRWGNVRFTTAANPGSTTDFLKRPQNC